MNEEKNMKNYLAKFEGLAKAFDITTKEMEENAQKIVTEIQNEYDENNSEVNNSIIESEMLNTDFQIMRMTLLNNIKSTKNLLSQFSDQITLEGIDVKPQLLSAYAELNESCNAGIKLLAEIYKNITETHLKIKKIKGEDVSSDNSKTTNNLIITDTNTLLKEIIEKKKN